MCSVPPSNNDHRTKFWKTLSLHYLFFEHDPVPPPSDTPTLLDSNSLLNAYYNFRTVVHVRTVCIKNINIHSICVWLQWTRHFVCFSEGSNKLEIISFRLIWFIQSRWLCYSNNTDQKSQEIVTVVNSDMTQTWLKPWKVILTWVLFVRVIFK